MSDAVEGDGETCQRPSIVEGRIAFTSNAPSGGTDDSSASLLQMPRDSSSPNGKVSTLRGLEKDYGRDNRTWSRGIGHGEVGAGMHALVDEDRDESLEGVTASVPRALSSIMSLSMQCLLACSLLIVVRAATVLRGGMPGPMERLLQTALAPIGFTPMHCALFLSVWLQSIWFTQRSSHAELGPLFSAMETVMVALTVILIAKTCLHIVVGCIIVCLVGAGGANGTSSDSGGDQQSPQSGLSEKYDDAEQNEGGGALETVACYLVSSSMYAGVGALVVGTLAMQRPSSHYFEGLGPAVCCTLFLSAQYFAITLTLQLSHDCASRRGACARRCFQLPTGALRRRTSIVGLSPMACIFLQSIQVYAPDEPAAVAARNSAAIQMAACALFLAILVQLSIDPTDAAAPAAAA
eukprot:CAMPEP_0115242536 /NCGR_PEP_ID=MMETSP0270-20121206/39005_1 /TAXON_ID=71861 /ORGANISM="Scrippsiella trochoidea, Strain CCMP3099" /LENGTH=407 /DNA_ID=CAMNT_0002657609 /DNA_START=242 /DNA_END=1462 /DNA_ORIENTATION=-